VIRLNVPALSTERRRQLSGRVKELAEEARVSIRNVRRDANKHADQAQKDKTLTEDDCDQTKEQVQDLTKKFESKVNDMATAKEKEVMND
jgi:ribosome recycling factor